MQNHIRVLGILNMVYGGITLLGALVIALIFGGVTGFLSSIDLDREARVALPIVALVGGFVFILLILLSLPSLIVGWGLMQYAPWSRVAGIVISALHLFSVPLGTALGVYGLWVLSQNEAQPLFERRPARFSA